MNIILATDSYKLTHWKQYPEGTETVYSYFESRAGAEFPYTVFFGLQHLLRQIAGRAVTHEDIDAAASLARTHFGADLFNRAGWEHIVDAHGGRLPLIIRAVPEGLPIPTGNVLMTVENTDPACWWLTNAMESFLTHVWYPSTVATLSRATKEIIRAALVRSGAPLDGLPFMLHDFGYRGATTHDAAAIGGAAHLVNFQGSDTLPAMELAMESYAAPLDGLASSVPATEHSVMTALGRDGELAQLDRMLDEYPTGILSVVADSYDIYSFVDTLGAEFWDRILARDGVLVVRPDSTTQRHPQPSQEINWIAESLYNAFGGERNSHGLKVIDPHVRILWGDGLDRNGISNILGALTLKGYSAENIAAFGMGGGLLQKVNRDTQRFAFKSSAQKRDGEWHGICKEPLDATKKSKAGRFELVRRGGILKTVTLAEAEDEPRAGEEVVMRLVFKDGEMVNTSTFGDVRARAGLI